MTKEQIKIRVAKRIDELTYAEVKQLQKLHQHQIETATTFVTDFVAWVKQYIVFQLEFLWHVTK